MSRRDFIQASGRAAAASLAAPAILRGASATADPVRVGHIGLGTRGGNLVRYTGQIDACRVVAVCDVYKPHLQKGVELSNNPEVRAYGDYQHLLDDPQVEAVVIATPDHWHEQMLLDAVAAGKDVYCEKGWTISVAAAKRMRAAVKEAGAVMQLGHQGRQLAAADVARKMILDGAIGDVTLVNVGRFFNGPRDRPPWRWYGGYDNYERPDPEQVIQDLDWESWLGSAPRSTSTSGTSGTGAATGPTAPARPATCSRTRWTTSSPSCATAFPTPASPPATTPSGTTTARCRTPGPAPTSSRSRTAPSPSRAA